MRRPFRLIWRGDLGRYGRTTLTVTPAIAVDVVRIRAAHLNSPMPAVLTTAGVWSSVLSNFP